MLRTAIILITIILLSSCISEKSSPPSDLIHNYMEQGFRNPPPSSQPGVYYWWLGGNVDTLRLKEEIKSLKDASVSGFTIFEIGSRDTVLVKPGPAFLSEKSLEFIKCAVTEAGKLDMTVGLNTASSWNAGGNWLPPEHAAKSIYFAEKNITGGQKINIKLPFPEIPEKDPWGKPGIIKYEAGEKPAFYQEIAVLAIPSCDELACLDTAGIINISGYFNSTNETLDWTAPGGKWKIIRYICSNSGENLVLPSKYSAGPIVDHFDADATEYHFLYIINKLESVLGNLKNSALKSLYMASYEAKALTWTTTLPSVFKKINGYDIYKFLPALFNKDAFNPEFTAIFRADYQRTLSELMINNFYKKSKEICNKYGLKTNCEAGGPGLPLHNVPVEPLKALGAGLDIPRGEFWINHSRLNEQGIDISRVVKEVSAAAHIYGRKFVEMEAFTTFQHWQEGPFEMKPVGDRSFCEGMNKVVVHGSTHNPSGTGFPGIVYHAGTHYNDKRVWWPKIKNFNQYLSRISFILQEAEFVSDVLFYYGDTIPNYGGHKHSRFSPGPGYDYEIINTDLLLKLTVSGNKIILPGKGAEFKMLALTDESEINPEVLLKLNELAGKGAVIIGEKPKKVASRKIKSGMGDVQNLHDKIWADFNKANKKIKTGKIYSGIKASEMLKYLDIIPDFNYTGNQFNTLDYIHYSKDDLNFYFIRNTTGEWISREVSFRQINKIPEIWDPVSGNIITVSIYREHDNCITLPLTLAPYGSTFVLFKNGNPKNQYISVKAENQYPPLLEYTKEGICFWEEGIFQLTCQNKEETVNNIMNIKTLEGPWEVFFPEGRGAPEKIIFPKLISWTKSNNEGIKYFSGIARYEKSFLHNINSDTAVKPKIYLDLGDLSNIGEVWLNDESLGITWTKPYRFDITDVIKAGANKLVIEIANTWSNRLAGDARTGSDYTSTNIKSTVIKNGFFITAQWSEVPLIESGLFGPVTLTTIQPVN